MKPFETAHILALSLLLASSLGGCSANSKDSLNQSDPAQTQLSEAGLKQVRLTISSGDRKHEFLVEVAQTAAQQQQGLMFRKQLAPNAGMIFPFAEDRVASFWMKNTVIPLDIIFVQRDGTIESIAADTTPYSLESVRSGKPVAAVLELAGGRGAELGLAPGDLVIWAD